jgi:hypothetical protein
VINAIAGHDALCDVGARKRVRKVAALAEKGTEEMNGTFGG